MQPSASTIEILGDFEEILPVSQEFLHIQFSPSSLPLQKRWRNNGLSADFMADYLVSFFLQDEGQGDLTEKSLHIKSAISFIANELLENAMKFNHEVSNIPTTITLHLLSEKIVFISTNSISPSSQKQLCTFIHQLLSSDPNQLYIKQLEEGALGQTASGLGILTMVNDYLAKIGWKFETVQNTIDVIVVTTMVQISV